MLQNKWTRKILKETATTLSPKKLDEFIAWSEHSLKYLLKMQTIFGQRKIARLRLQKTIGRQKCAMKMAKLILSTKKQERPSPPTNSLVLIGDNMNYSGMHGYIGTAQRRIIAELKKLADVHIIDEYGTTKFCAKCKIGKCVTSKSPHRYQYCKMCKTTWNRDINAGLNILHLGVDEILGRTRTTQFQRPSFI